MKKAAFVTALSLVAVIGCDRPDTGNMGEGTSSISPPSQTAMDDTATEAPPMAGSEESAAGAVDQELTQRVEQALSADPAAQNIQITAANGEVTLMGSVSTEQEKTNLAKKAQQVAGVTKVNNQLEVGVASR